MEGFDLSRVISLISENPEIVTMIKGLMGGGSVETAAPEDKAYADGISASQESDATDEPDGDSEANAEEASIPLSTEPDLKKRRRQDLLCALKPYVKGERGRVIDTMLSLNEMLDVLKRK